MDPGSGSIVVELAKHALDIAFKGFEAQTQRRAAPPTAKEEHKNRLEIIKSGHFMWINMLENSLHNKILLPLELYEQTDISDNPFRICVQETNQPAHMLPAGTSISEVYQKSPGELLILGEPGAGKTTLLLQLARDQLNRAEADEGEPIPVIFHLASWAENQVPLDRWLTEEMDKKYHIQKKIGWFWIKSKELLLLLDGLDEVAPQAREKCIQAINDYRQKYSPVHIVICSRYNEYFNQAVKLHPDCVIRIQPLTDELVNDYLTKLGKQGAGIHTMLQDDENLYKMSTTPFMLDVLTQAYPDRSSCTTLNPPRQQLSERLAHHLSGGLIRSVVPKLWRTTIEAKQQHFFTTYVERMLKHRHKSIHTCEQTVRWLAFLAREMTQQNLTTFSTQYVQPDSQSAQRDQFLVVWFPRMVMGILVSLLVNALLLGFYPGSILPYIAIAALIANLLSTSKSEEQPIESNMISRNSWRCRFIRCITNSVLINTLLIALITILNIMPYFNYIYPENEQTVSIKTQFILIIGGSVAILSLFASLLSKVTSQETNHLKNGMLVGGFIGLIPALSYGWLVGQKIKPNCGLFTGLLAGLHDWVIYIPVSILLSAILVKITGTIQPIRAVVCSRSNLWRSFFNRKHLINALSIGIFIGLIVAVLHTTSSLLQYPVKSSLYLKCDLSNPWGSLYPGNILLGALHHWLISLLIYGLGYWLMIGFFNGLHSDSLDEDYHFEPNEGVLHSQKNSLTIGPFTVISCLLFYIAAYTVYTKYANPLLGCDMHVVDCYHYLPSFMSIWNIGNIWDANIMPGLIVTLLAGFTIPALREFYFVYIQQSILRRFLRHSGSLPWDLPEFLDDANKRILLDDIGGGYRFHPLLLKYFADLSDEQIRAYREVVPRR